MLKVRGNRRGFRLFHREIDWPTIPSNVRKTLRATTRARNARNRCAQTQPIGTRTPKAFHSQHQPGVRMVGNRDNPPGQVIFFRPRGAAAAYRRNRELPKRAWTTVPGGRHFHKAPRRQRIQIGEDGLPILWLISSTMIINEVCNIVDIILRRIVLR